MKAVELFAKCLENEGVEYIFGVPGEENVDILDALLNSPIRVVTTRHEQGAAFMADVYGRLTRKAESAFDAWTRCNQSEVDKKVEGPGFAAMNRLKPYGPRFFAL